MSQKILFIGVIVFLFLIPFFWIPVGTMDLGGDSSRLYFYDPVSYLKNFSFYFVVPQGLGFVEPNFYSLPFLSVLVVIKEFINSTYLVICLFNSLKLIVAFVSIFYIVKIFLRNFTLNKNTYFYSGIVAGIFYIFTPTMTGNWDRALLSHSQVFINPLIFLLLLQFIETNKEKFLWWALLVSFIFSSNFAYTSAPPFFAFFPLALLFLFIYKLSFKKVISYRKLTFTVILFLGLQSFHLLPQIVNLFEPGSYVNSRVFDKSTIINEGLRYFTAILPIAKVSNYVLLTYGLKEQLLTSFIPFFFILLGFILNKKIRKLMILTALFYLISLFLLSGNMTQIGTKFYQLLFYIPGFSMFRNFIGQWLFVFSFFNSLIVGFAFAAISEKVGGKTRIILALILILVMLLTSFYFITGRFVNRILLPNSNYKIAQSFKNDFLMTVSYVKELEDDSKFLILPLTDAYYQVVPGDKNGVYVGPSIIAYLAGKKDFAGHQVLSPYGDDFLQLIREGRYKDFQELLGILNINYIIHNSSEFVLDDNNEGFLYSNVGQYLPQNQSGYSELLANIGAKKVKNFGDYTIYEVSRDYAFEHIYISEKNHVYKEGSTLSASLKAVDFRKNHVFIDSLTCEKISCESYSKISGTISYKKINPTRYEIYVNDASDKYMLVFLEAFHKKWNAYIDLSYDNSIDSNNKSNGIIQGKEDFQWIGDIIETLGLPKLDKTKHVSVNYYGNGWLVSPEDSNGKSSYKIILELELQRVFYLSAIITLFSLVVLGIWRYKISRS